MTKPIDQMRRKYHRGPLEREDLDADPIVQFGRWFDEACERGLTRVLVTCDTENIPSVRIIERNGGVLENRETSARSGKQISRYWVEL